MRCNQALWWPAALAAGAGVASANLATDFLTARQSAPDAAKLSGAGSSSLPPVRFQVYPAPTCPNCRLMIEDGILPLVRAGLPGDQVEITVLPWGSGAKGEDGLWHSKAQQNNAYDLLCGMELCALRQGASSSSTEPSAMPVSRRRLGGRSAGAGSSSSSALRRGVEFVACHMREVQAQDGADVASLTPAFETCATQAGLDWQGAGGIAECAAGEGLDMQLGEDYAARISWVYQQPHWTNPPYLFLNGRPLNCPSPTYCESIWTPDGDQALDAPGSPLDVACSLLDPQPEACKNRAHSSTETSTVTKFCENCWETGAFRWAAAGGGRGRRGLSAWLAVASVASGALAGSLGLGIWLCRRQRTSEEGHFLPAE